MRTPGFGQATGTIKVSAKDATPVVGAYVEWANTDNGRKYNLKTNKKGEYFSLGIEPGKYKVTLTQDGKQLDQVSNFPVGLDEAVLDFDLKKSQVEAAQQKGISAEQLKQMQEAQEKNAKEVNTVKTLNEKLALANNAMQTGDFETAVTTLNEATQMDPSRDLLWARLGDANLGAGPKQADTTQKAKRYGDAVTDYQKAIDLRKQACQALRSPMILKSWLPTTTISARRKPGAASWMKLLILRSGCAVESRRGRTVLLQSGRGAYQ